MYEYIKGEVAALELSRVVIECGGIGYSVNISLTSHGELSQVQEEAITKLFIHQYQVRDDLPVLFGFTSWNEREIFRMLVAVSGVGGGTALNILSTFSAADLRTIISTGDSVVLKKVKGLGQKTAEKIIVELRDKIIKVDTGAASGSTVAPTEGHVTKNSAAYEEALSALTMLGFAKGVSAKALDKVVEQMPKAKVEDLVRMTLKSL